MRHNMKLDEYLEECGHTDRVFNTLKHFATRRQQDANELFAEFSKYHMVQNAVTSRSGQISYSKKQVELHNELLRSGRELARDQTLLHETAHLIVHLTFTRQPFNRPKPHGPEWQAVMRHLGCKPNRCSNHDFLHDARAKKAKLMYACQRCEFEFPAQRRKKQPAESYYHKRCQGKLYLKRDANGREHPNPSKAIV